MVGVDNHPICVVIAATVALTCLQEKNPSAPALKEIDLTSVVRDFIMNLKVQFTQFEDGMDVNITVVPKVLLISWGALTAFVFPIICITRGWKVEFIGTFECA